MVARKKQSFCWNNKKVTRITRNNSNLPNQTDFQNYITKWYHLNLHFLFDTSYFSFVEIHSMKNGQVWTPIRDTDITRHEHVDTLNPKNLRYGHANNRSIKIDVCMYKCACKYIFKEINIDYID